MIKRNRETMTAKNIPKDNLENSLALLKEAQLLRAKNETLKAANRVLSERLATISDFTFEGLNRYGAEREMLEQIESALNGDYDPEVTP